MKVELKLQVSYSIRKKLSYATSDNMGVLQSKRKCISGVLHLKAETEVKVEHFCDRVEYSVMDWGGCHASLIV